MRSPLALCRLIWGLGAASAVVVAGALILDVQFGFVSLVILAGAMGGVTTALWYAYARPEALSLGRLAAAFALGAVVWLVLTNPIAMLLGFGLVAAAWLPLVVVCLLAVTFRPIVLGTVRSPTPPA